MNRFGVGRHSLGMTTMHRTSLLAATLSILAAGGCLHHQAPAACSTAPGESACWESARVDDRGELSHHIVERVTPGDECDTTVVEQTSFAGGKVVQRVRDTRRCRVVDHRITDRYDVETGRLHREVAQDLDHDAEFDAVQTFDVAMSASQRLFAVTTGWQRMVRLQQRLGDETPRSMMASRR